MSILNKIMQVAAPILPPILKPMMDPAWKIAQGYKDMRSEVFRAVADRNLTLAQKQRMVGYLDNPLVGGLIEKFYPGGVSQLKDIGRELLGNASSTDAPGGASDSGQTPEQRVQSRFPRIR